MSVVALIVLANLAAVGATAHGQHSSGPVADTGNLDARYPPVEVVRERHKGVDAQDTAARQAAAFTILALRLKDETGKWPWRIEDMPPVAQERHREYMAARDEAVAAGGGGTAMHKYFSSTEFTREVLDHQMTWKDRALIVLFDTLEPIVEAFDRAVNESDVDGAQIGWLAAALLALVPGTLVLYVSGRMPFGLTKLNPLAWRVGRRVYDLKAHSGELVGYGQHRYLKQHTITTTEYHGHASIPTKHVDSFHTKHVDEELWIRSSDGRESKVRLANWDVDVREGHTVSAIGAIPPNKDEGRTIAIINHSTDQYFLKEDEVMKIARIGRWYTWTIAPSMLPLFVIKNQTAWVTAFAALVVVSQLGWSYRWWVNRRRRAKFKKQFVNRVVPALEANLRGGAKLQDTAKDLLKGFAGGLLDR